MAGKKVQFNKKPASDTSASNLEDWVSARSVTNESLPTTAADKKPQPEKMKRLTLDIPSSLHKAIKMKATEEGVTMADLLRELLEEKYGSANQ